MKIAVLTPDDWQMLREVRLKALADCPDAFTSTLAEETGKTEADWRGQLASPDWRTFVAFVDGEPSGMVRAGTLEGRKGIFAMWVDPQHRGKAVGDTLLHSAIGWAKANGAASVYLEVADSNASAIKLYERHGFLPTGNLSSLPPPRTHIKEHERLLTFGQ